MKAAAQEDSSSPNHGGADKSAAERERQRLREQERRRREAVSSIFRRLFFQVKNLRLILLKKFILFLQLAGQIDMNMQSDLMAAFEESL